MIAEVKVPTGFTRDDISQAYLVAEFIKTHAWPTNQFTSRDVAKALNVERRIVSAALQKLKLRGVVRAVHKDGRAFVYSANRDSFENVVLPLPRKRPVDYSPNRSGPRAAPIDPAPPALEVAAVAPPTPRDDFVLALLDIAIEAERNGVTRGLCLRLVERAVIELGRVSARENQK